MNTAIPPRSGVAPPAAAAAPLLASGPVPTFASRDDGSGRRSRARRELTRGRALGLAFNEERDNFLAYFNTMPPSLGKLLELVPVAADAYYLMRQGTLG